MVMLCFGYCIIVILHRGGQGNRFEVWAITVKERLTRILIPLADRRL
ncbi:MAG: DUF4058 family protein [Armatimonadetes bacterium]|nr:DUF4058 family protein [Armatimonadota bacterium]MDW8026981.1 hypothetical protein [Armatimonadota bacterium]